MTVIIDKSWTDFKALLTSKADLMDYSTQYETVNGYYKIWIIEQNTMYVCMILIEDPASVDQDDFETNYKADCNECMCANVVGEGCNVLRMTIALTASDVVLTPTNGKELHVFSIKFTLSDDMDDVSFRFNDDGTDFEKYLFPKTGGQYGSMQNPHFIEGEIDDELYCVITGTGTVQINVEYSEE